MRFYDIIRTIFLKNKILFKNFSSLSLLQISQYLIPLITFPYLVRVLGPDGYGLVAFATAFVGYFTVITDYGFNLSATKQISLNRSDKKKTSEIFNSVLTVKLLLFLLSILVVIPITLLFDRFNKDAAIYLISFVSVFGTVLFPVWFFQGIERMGYISAISITLKILWAISIFIFVHSYNDILILVSLNTLSSLLTGIIGITIVVFGFKVKIEVPNKNLIKYQFNKGWHYFLSTASISLYTISNIFILGLFASDTVVGYFSAADKIRQAIQNLSSSAGTTIFPHLSSEFNRSKTAAINFLRKYVLIVGTLTFLASLTLFVFSKQIVLVVLGADYLQSVILLKIISFLPIIIFFSNVAGIQTMLNMGFKKEFANIIMIAGIFNIFLSFIIIPIYLNVGTAIMVMLTEILVTSQMVLFLRRKKIHVFRNLLSSI